MTTKTKASDVCISWTADHEQYWQGHGITFTSYTHCATGAGDTLREAYEDALEDLAQQDIELTAEQEAELLADLASQVSSDVREPLDMTIIDAYCDANGEHTRTHECTDECPEDCSIDTEADDNPDCAVCAGEWHFYVSIDVTVADTYDVIVGNIGTVYSGTDLEEATKHYAEYVGQSRLDYGRAAGESVTLMRNGESMREHQGTQAEA